MCASHKIWTPNATYISHAPITQHTLVGKYANTYGTYEVTGINNVKRVLCINDNNANDNTNNNDDNAA